MRPQGRWSRPRRGPGRMLGWGWLQLLRRRLLPRLRSRCRRHASLDRPDSSLAWIRPR
jgi:hypothetical protein